MARKSVSDLCMAELSCLCGEFDDGGETAAGTVGDLQRSVTGGGDVARDGEAQPGAGHGLIQPGAAFGQQNQRRIRNAGTIVQHMNAQQRVHRFRRDAGLIPKEITVADIVWSAARS